MSLDTNLKGRLRNTSLPLSSGLLPLFEAVVNSVHAIEERGVPLDQGLVRVEILRKTKPAELFADDSKRRGPDAKGDVAGFRIIDNGMGFNDENMKSFNTLDSDHKISKGGRGVGRLLWLKSFKLVQVESVFKADDGKHKQRRFRFDAASGVSCEEIVDGDEKVPTGSIIHLDEFDERYRAYTRKTGKAIAEAILEHCLWYYLRPGGAPDIRIDDDGDHFLLLTPSLSTCTRRPSPKRSKSKSDSLTLSMRSCARTHSLPTLSHTVQINAW